MIELGLDLIYYLSTRTQVRNIDSNIFHSLAVPYSLVAFRSAVRNQTYLSNPRLTLMDRQTYIHYAANSYIVTVSANCFARL